MRADGTGATRITRPSGANDLFPSWSPSSRQIAFVRAPANSKGYLAGKVFIVNVDGTHLRRIAAPPGEFSGLSWSPDGTSFAYTRQFYLYVMQADGSNARRLAPSLTDVTGFSWSPDALRLAAAQDLYPRHEIDVVDADGTGDEEVLVRDVRASDLVWSPDGRQIAFRNSNFRITVADIASGPCMSSRRVTSRTGNPCNEDRCPPP